MSVNMALQPCRDCGARPGMAHFDGCPQDGALMSAVPLPSPSAPPLSSASPVAPLTSPPKYPVGTPQADTLHQALKRMGG
ncbi:hypothetical protein D3877_11945 [Azospirillum cavernae]|uniref:Uncharacterized protein n=1 Tax=Azospirillum cavernae TaxID=2320860 RepID=A0A418VUX1_9PROT|nr:hypothetical protein [Azospirillum cavernae]RJF80940.1 hypothetical protein D3877_11945 [Azospirillum cavernae]